MKTEGIISILIVDDEPQILKSLDRLLSLQSGWSVIPFLNALDALSYLETNSPDVIISDERMPGLHGSEFLSRVRMSHPDVPRIILTGYADQQAIIKSINDAEVFRYVQKPWDNDELISIIKMALEYIKNVSRMSDLGIQLISQRNELIALNQKLEKEAKNTKEKLEESLGVLMQYKDVTKCFRSDIIRTILVLTAIYDQGLVDLAKKIAAAYQKMLTVMGIPNSQELWDAALLSGLLTDAGMGVAVFFSKLEGLTQVVSILFDMNENCNGTGPRCISSIKLSKESRLLRIVHDFYQYNMLLPGSGALQLAKGSYRMYDADLVVAFMEAIGRFEFDAIPAKSTDSIKPIIKD